VLLSYRANSTRQIASTSGPVCSSARSCAPAIAATPDQSPALIGDSALCDRYQRAFAVFGIPNVRFIEASTLPAFGKLQCRRASFRIARFRFTGGRTAMIETYLERLPLIAILRGVTPDEAVPLGRAQLSGKPDRKHTPAPRDARRKVSDRCGTVTEPAMAPVIAKAGGRVMVMPHSDAAALRAAREAGLYCMPGVGTPIEGFAALASGASALKLFPAELLGPAVVKAWRSVFPRNVAFLPVHHARQYGAVHDCRRGWIRPGVRAVSLGHGRR
jgi:2-dehydro-3-deoxyphosphogalactonate aldolase